MSTGDLLALDAMTGWYGFVDRLTPEVALLGLLAAAAAVAWELAR
jgi:hypothetical protein